MLESDAMHIMLGSMINITVKEGKRSVFPVSSHVLIPLIITVGPCVTLCNMISLRIHVLMNPSTSGLFVWTVHSIHTGFHYKRAVVIEGTCPYSLLW